jgi:hypothetical protein
MTCEHLAPLGRNTVPPSVGGGFGSHKTHLCPLLPTGHSRKWMNRLMVLYCKCVTRDAYDSKNALFLSPGWTNYIPHTFLLVSLIMIAIEIYVTLNHFKIVFKFSLTFHWLLFTYGICLLPSLVFFAAMMLPLKLLPTVS